jgi:hypothetical protein
MNEKEVILYNVGGYVTDSDITSAVMTIEDSDGDDTELSQLKLL